MSPSLAHRHAPASVRHAFALAFDLAVRRDALHSLVVPLLLRAPWIIALALLPPIGETDQPGRVLLLMSAAVLGDWLLFIVITAMLRLRARSVFNTPAEVHPAPVGECYALGLRRMPWLVITEAARNVTLAFATSFFFVPGIYLGFRLSYATEAVVLGEPHTAAAFRRSFHLTDGRFERWLEMIAASAAIVFSACFAGAVLSVAFPGPGLNTWVAVTWLLVTAVTPIVQYAWTFFYLRLVEVEEPGIEVGPAYANRPPRAVGASDAPAERAAEGEALAARPGAPRLTLVETPREGDPGGNA